MKSRGFALGVLIPLTVIAGSVGRVAIAEHACVSYSLTTPVYGDGGEKCSPVPLPNFTGFHGFGHCGEFQVAGSTICASESTHVP